MAIGHRLSGRVRVDELRAKQQQARDLSCEADNHALAVFNQLLAMMAKDEPRPRDKDKYAEFTAFALAGKCVILSKQNKPHESADFMKQLSSVRDELRDNQMKLLLRARR